MKKILVADTLAEEGLEILKTEKGVSIDIKTGLNPEGLSKIIKGYDAVIVRSATRITKEVIDSAKGLKVIGRAGVGLDNVDVEEASKCGIIVMNVPGGNTISTCEHTMSMLLALSRGIPAADASVKAGRWERAKYVGVELYGKTLGIVGLGKIGGEVAKRALAFGMNVIAYDPYLSMERAGHLEVTLAGGLDELLKKADYISVHVPKTKDTTHMIGQEQFKLMKKGVRIINCARGGIVDEAALIEAIQKGIVSGAALDVFEEEPPKSTALLKLDNVVLTPHLGASTQEAQVNVSIDIAKQVCDALLGRGIRNAVNVPCIDPKILKEIEPYVKLAENLGNFQAQLIDGRIIEVKIKYTGDVTLTETSPITIALIKGLLFPILGETVNYVNASFIASERGIKIIEAKSSKVEDFANLIEMEVHSDKGVSSVTGTLFTKVDPRIVKIDNYYVDAIPSGYMIVTYNLDRPGIVGEIGTILGENNINIAGMTFGRESLGGKAITVLNVDSRVPDKVLERIKKARHITGVKLIKL